MKYRKFNKYEKKEMRAQMIAEALHGEGLYLFENNLNATLTLPRPTNSGIKVLSPKGQVNSQFQGDNYYMQLVRSGMLRLIKELQSPQEEAKMEEKLILDQPETITEQGKVEQVVNKDTPIQKLHEGADGKQPDVLLNEGPVEGGFVIVGG